jgi:hypothetical protein
MNTPDELEQLWKTQPLGAVTKGEEMRDMVLKKITAFDRMIRVRNRIECLAALAVAGFFTYAAWIQRNGIERLGSVVVVAGALWIVYYIWRHGTEAPDPRPDQMLASYRRALALKYEHQIRLLRNVKFWYLLPMYIGLLIGTAGLLKEQAESRSLTWADAFGPLGYTLIFAGVWWLNEVYTVGKLKRWRAQVVVGLDEETGA